MIVTLQQENLLLNVGVPDEDIMVKTSTQKQMLLIIPFKRINTSLMAYELMLRFQILQGP
jgi:hypothetical protein